MVSSCYALPDKTASLSVSRSAETEMLSKSLNQRILIGYDESWDELVASKKGKERKGTLFKCLVVLALER